MRVTADECGVTHPLYGYKTDIIDRLPDRVPGWAFVPAARTGDEFSKTDTAEYLNAAIDEYQNATVEDGERFELSVTAAGFPSNVGKPDSISVRFRAEPDATHMTRGGSQSHMPADMRERLDEIKQSSQFDQKFDGYHVRFRGWEFTVTIGPRGGIRDIDMFAWGKR